MSNFANGSEAPLSYSDRKAQALSGEQPWSLEDLVEAQNMDCQLVPREQIAEALHRSLADVNRKLNPPTAPPRTDRAGVGFAHLKGR